MKHSIVFLSVIVFLIGALQILAQENGSIEGKLIDSNGTPVAGAAVTLQGTDTTNKMETTSNEKGEFTILDLMPGTYTLTAEAAGYTAIKKEKITIKAGSSASFEMVMVAEKKAEPTATAPTETTTSSTQEFPAPGKAFIYVYRHKRVEGFALNPGVYLDDKQIAAMDNGRYFAMAIEPGLHTLRSNDKNSGVEMEFKPNETYYARIEIKTGFWKGHGMMVLVLKEQGAYEIKALKPLNLDMVKNHELVIIPSAK
jgi:Carboxypeptidase regulatory-like domain/Protein of unknown function (DUF2846)